MDLTKFSTDDLVALQAGDLSKVSTGGLKILQSQHRQAKIDAQVAEDRKTYDPTIGMSGPDKFLAGAGKAFSDIGLGVRQLVGAAPQEEVDETKRRDAPLMNTGAGLAGNVTGNVAAMLPAAFIPGGASIPGAAAVGALTGAIGPVASDESRLQNATVGGLAGPAGIVVGRTGAALAKGAKALAEPLYEGGRQAIAGRTLQRFGVNPSDVVGATSAPTLTGARTTLAEQIADPQAAAGAARLQDSVRSLDPEIAARMTAREVENNAARVGTMRDLAGDGGARDFAAANRDATADQLYDAARKAGIAPKVLAQPGVSENLAAMQARMPPEVLERARTLAQINGTPMTDATSIQGMQWTKKALDSLVTKAKASGDADLSRAYAGLRNDFLTGLDRLSPDFAAARGTFAAMSRPVNQMDTAAEVLRRGSSATGDLGGNPRLMPEALARAVRDEGKLTASATGGPQQSLADLLEPDQLARLRAVVDETGRSAAVSRAGAGPGSPTAQRLASQNVLRQLLGPTGLPESWSESTLLNSVLRPVQFAYNGVAEPRIQQTLADLVLNPDRARAALAAASPAQRSRLSDLLSNPLVQQAARSSAPAIAMSGQR